MIENVHSKFESNNFFDLLRKHELPAVSFTTYLVCRSIFYAALEKKISLSTDIRIRKIWGPECFKFSLLFKYMQSLHVAKSPVIEPAVRMSLQLAAEIVTQESQGLEVAFLSGYLYALESFQVYSRSSLKELLRRMNAFSFNEEEVRIFISTSEAAELALEKVTTALFPYTDDQIKFHICTVNPEAGNHVMPQDPKEIEVALRASSRVFQRFPYLKERYGERGERFIVSYSCWLVALIPLELKAIQESISWLRTILAKRGLPSLILESLMEDIIQFYLELIPEKKESLDCFLKVSSALKFERYRAVGKESFDQGEEAALLASAWADEMAGIHGAFKAVESWFANGTRSTSNCAAL